MEKLDSKKKKPVATSSEGGVIGKKKRKRLTKKVNQDRFKSGKAKKKKSFQVEPLLTEDISSDPAPESLFCIGVIGAFVTSGINKTHLEIIVLRACVVLSL